MPQCNAPGKGRHIAWALDRFANNKTQAAKVLGIDRASLWRKLKRYGLG